MSKTLKWILGIVLILIVLALVAGTGLFVFARYFGFNRYGMMPGGMPFYGPNNGVPNYGPRSPYPNMPMHPYGFPSGRVAPFGLLGLIPSLFGCLLVVGLIALVLFLLLRRPASTVVSPAVGPSPAVPPEAPGEPAAAGSTVTTHPCPNCGRTVQEDWNNCPYCGAVLHHD